MKEIKLTQGKVALVDDEDYDYLMQWKWQAIRGGYTFYASRGFYNGKNSGKILMHREIMNTPIDMQVDHIDHNGLNNQKNNLRNCSHMQNVCNRKSNGTVPYLGVHFKKDGGYEVYIAAIKVNKKTIQIGCFKTAKEAALAYDSVAKKMHGEFANLNFK